MAEYVLVGELAVLLALLSQLIHTTANRPARARANRWLELLGRRPWAYGGFNVADLALALLLIGFSGFRYVVGTDFELYSGMYRRLDTSDWWRALTTTPQEPGFTLLRLMVKSLLGGNPVALFLVTSTLVVVPTLVAFKRLAANRLALVVGVWYGLACYVTTFNGVRQAVAGALILLAVSLATRHLRWAVGIAAVACTIHVSAILAVALLAVTWRWRPSPRTLALVVGGAVVGFLAAVPLLAPLLSMVNPRYGRYIASAAPAGVGTYVQAAGLLALLWLIQRRDVVRSAWERRWFVWSAIGLGLLLFGLRIVEFGRLHIYFRTYVALLVPVALARSTHKVRDTVIVGLGLLAYLLLHLGFYDDLLPYRVWIGYAR